MLSFKTSLCCSRTSVEEMHVVFVVIVIAIVVMFTFVVVVVLFKSKNTTLDLC